MEDETNDRDTIEPSILAAARTLGQRVYAEAYGALDRGVGRLGAVGRAGGAGARGGIGGPGAVGSWVSGEGPLGDLLEAVGLGGGLGRGARSGTAGDLVALAQGVAQVVLHTATTAGEALLDGAKSLERLLEEADGGTAPGGAAARAAAPSGTAPAGTAPTGTAPTGAVPGEPSAAPPVALALPATSPGGTASGAFRVRNDSLEMVDALRFRCGGLFGPGDLRITQARIRFDPPVVDVDPKGNAVTTCVVAVPKSAKLGHYTGLVEAAGLSGVQLLVTLDVL